MDEFISKKLLVAKFNELASKYIDGDKRQRGLAYGTIRSTLQAQMFLRNDLRNPEGFCKATEKPMNKLVEKLAEVAKEHCENETNTAYSDNTLCECWKLYKGYAICKGTKELDVCRCGGDVKKCDFYPEKRGETNDRV